MLFALIALFSLASANEVEKIEEGKELEGFDPSAFSADELAAIDAGAGKHEFQAEVSRLMEIIIHSLYTDRSIFMRELISNAGDALDKIRFKSLTNKEELSTNAELDIRVKIDKESNSITIRDSGVGMTGQELRENLGTVAKSGTAKFLEAFAQGKDSGDALQLIGQFGVGFYSAFLVADEVIVVSKSNDDDKQYIWKSAADGQFTIAEDPRGNTLGRGTAIILKLKEDADEFLKQSRIEDLIKRYSQFTQYPLLVWDKKVETEEVPVEKDEEEIAEENEDDDELTAEDDDDEEEEEEEMKKIEKTIYSWKRLNENKPLWTRSKDDISEEEYQAFFKALTSSGDEAQAYTHFKAEGEIEFSSLLYIPKTAPFGFYDNYYSSKASLQLYVRRVLVADEFEDLVPRYLNFMKGIVDSNDLPLNVNREQLQKNKVMKVISKKLTRKSLDLIRKLSEAEEGSDEDEDDEFDEVEEKSEEESTEEKVEEKSTKYSDFWKEYGKSIKLGVIEDTKNRKKLLPLLRFTSTASEEPISLSSYVERMKDGQENIYYITAATLEEAKSSPMLEQITKKGFEVLFFVDNLDEYLNLNEFDDFTLQSITKEGLDLNEGRAAKKYMEEKEEEFEEFTEWMKELLGSKVSKVMLSNRLEETPMVIVTTKYGATANMERISRGQTFGREGPKSTKILELNFRHPVIINLKEKIADDKENDSAKDLAELMFDSALLQSGFTIEADSVGNFAGRIDRIARARLGVEADAEVEPLPEFPDDEEEDEDEEDEDDEDDEDLDADEDDEDVDADEEEAVEKEEL